jgi:putative transposase
MFDFLRLCFKTFLRLFYTHRRLVLENLALRQQLAVRQRRHRRPRLTAADKLFWTVRRFWCMWKRSLIIVKPETVVRWHRAGFRMYWSLISKVRKRVGRKRISKEVRSFVP